MVVVYMTWLVDEEGIDRVPAHDISEVRKMADQEGVSIVD